MSGEDGAAPPPFDAAAIRAVAFDAYGTLFDWNFRACLDRALAEQGLAVEDPEAVAKSFEQAWNRVSPFAEPGAGEKPDRARLLGGEIPDFVPTWEIWRRQFAWVFGEQGLDGDACAGADLFRDALSRAPAYPDAREAVDALGAAGYRLGLLSNADEDFLQSAISHNRLRFSVIQSSESLRCYKPHETTFGELCRRLGCEPGEVLYVGDSPQADVLGARHAGLRVAWVRRGGDGYEWPEDYPRPDHAVDSLTAAAAVLGVGVGVAAAANEAAR